MRSHQYILTWPFPALPVGDPFSSPMVLSGQISQAVPLEQRRGKLVFKAALGGCSLFKTACADCSCEMVWNGEHWCEYRQKHLPVLPGWDCISKSEEVVVNSKAKGCASGRKMALALNAVHPSLCPVEGMCKTYQKQKIKSISSSGTMNCSCFAVPGCSDPFSLAPQLQGLFLCRLDFVNLC